MACFAGDEQDNPRALPDCERKPAFKPRMRGREIMLVEVNCEIGRNHAAREPLVPVSIERIGVLGRWFALCRGFRVDDVRGCQRGVA